MWGKQRVLSLPDLSFWQWAQTLCTFSWLCRFSLALAFAPPVADATLKFAARSANSEDWLSCASLLSRVLRPLSSCSRWILGTRLVAGRLSLSPSWLAPRLPSASAQLATLSCIRDIYSRESYTASRKHASSLTGRGRGVRAYPCTDT